MHHILYPLMILMSGFTVTTHYSVFITQYTVFPSFTPHLHHHFLEFELQLEQQEHLADC